MRLQALAATPAEMAPVLDTLDRIADTMSLGDSARVEQQLTTLSGQLRALLERQDKAVKVAFAQSDGQAFIQDLGRAILARASDDAHLPVALELEHFMGPYLKGAFDEVVSGMLDANPDVQRASFKLPFDANVGVVALRNVAHVLHELLKPPAATKQEEAERPTPSDLRREIGHFLGLVRSGAIAPELAQALLGAMDGDDTQAFIDVMSHSLLASLPLDQREQVRALLDIHLAPVVQDDVTQHGPLKIASSPTLPLQPKTHFDAPLLPPARLGLLQGTAAQTQTALATLAGVSQAMSSSNPDAVKNKLGQLMGQLKPLLQAQPEAVRMAFTLSDGRGFVDDLAEAILEQTPASEREFVATQLELFMRPALHRAFDRLASGVLDRAELDPGNPDDPPRSVTVGGRTYELVKDKNGVPDLIGEGNFGMIFKYRNPEEVSDQVVLKLPLKGDAASGSAQARKRMLEDPAREGFTSLLAMGTGGGSARPAQLLGAVRTNDRMLLIYRFEGGGSLKAKVGTLNQGITDEKVARGKLGLMQDLVGALRRLHEAKGVVHLDIALRNVLLDDKGRAVLNDFGMSQPLPEGSTLDGASARPGTDLLPLRWTAPEVRQGQPVTQKAEVFSLGVTFIELVWGLQKGMPPWSMLPVSTFTSSGPPWDAQAMMAALPALPAALWPGVDRVQLQQLITRMIDANPANRPTLAEVAASPVFQGVLPEHREALLAKLNGAVAPAPAPAVAPTAPAVAPPAPPMPPAPAAPSPLAVQPDLYQNSRS